jgi:aminoglycoside/choline kinase family phosphotransferase
MSREVLDERVAAYLVERRGAAGASLGIVALSGDASTRRYLRIVEKGRTTVLALYPEPFDPADMPFLVVRSLLDGWGLPVPAVLDHDGARGIVLLEDLGDLTVQAALGDPGSRDDLYGQALDQLACLQREAARAEPKAACFRIAFDIEKLSWELHYFLKHFVEGHRGRQPTVTDRVTLAEAFHRLSEEIASWPRVLCHRDYHSRNLMVQDGSIRWLDFQDARMGPATYDLASLLRDSYVDLPEEFVADRAEEFRRKALSGEARDVFLRRFDLASVQRNLKALGTFGYMASVRGRDVYARYVPRTLAHVRRNLERYVELEPLRRALGPHVEELA